MGKHRNIVIFLGLLASAVFMYLAVRRLDLDTLKTTFSRAAIFPWVPLGILSYVCGHIVRGLRCQLLVRREAKLRLVTASNIVVVGYAANNVFPARLGELVRAGMLAERTGIPIAQSLLVTFIERILDGLAILLLLVIGTMTSPRIGWTTDLVRIALLVFGSASGVMMFGIYAPGLVVNAASRIGNKLGTRWHDRLVSLATSITNAGACLRDPRDAVLILGYSVLVWVLETGLFLAILPAFAIEPSFTAAAVAMSVTNLGLLVPSSPGFIGPFHFFCSRALMTRGIDEATALTYAAIVHLAFYIPVTLWGAVSMLWYGVEVGATAAMSRQARTKADRTITVKGLVLHELAALAPIRHDETASAFTLAIVEAVVVSKGKASDRVALKEAADFVQGQLNVLPGQLKVLFEAGMTFFRFVTRLRFFRGFCDLALETRRRWVLDWAENRYALFRKLFKPVRATALLAYYDNPRVRDIVDKDPASLFPARGLLRRIAGISQRTKGTNGTASGNGAHIETDQHPHFELENDSHSTMADTSSLAIVTGAPGWLGTRLVQSLIKGVVDVPALGPSERRVRCLVLPDAPAADVKELEALGKQVEIVRGDVTDAASLEKLFTTEGVEGATVFHSAGIIHPSKGAQQFRDVNVEGTRNMLEAAKKAKVRRFIHVSSNSPIGTNPSPEHVFDETSPYNPYMTYGKTKKMAEEIVREAHASGAIETVIIRPPWFYGPGQPPRQTLFFEMIRDGKAPIVGGGKNRRSMAYVDNICQGLLLCEKVDRAAGEIYWIADRRPYEMNEIIATIEKVMEKDFDVKCAHGRMKLPGLASEVAWLFDAVIQGVGSYHQKLHVLSEMNKTIACSIDKAESELGYDPKVDLEEGMRRSIKWMLDRGEKL